MNDMYIEHKAEFIKQLADLLFTPHYIIDAAYKEGIHFSDYIVQLLT